MSVKLDVVSDITSLARGLAVIRAFDNFFKPLSLVEISNNISVSFAKTQSICENLVELGYLSKNNSNNCYYPTSLCLKLASGFFNLSPLLQTALPELNGISSSMEGNVSLIGYDQYELTLLFCTNSYQLEELDAPGKSKDLLYTAAGRAILSHLPAMDVVSLIFSAERIPFTTKTIIEPKTLMVEIEQTSKNGFAVVSREKNDETVSIASAILDNRNEPIGAVELTGAWEKLRWARKRERLGNAVQTLSTSISTNLKNNSLS